MKLSINELLEVARRAGFSDTDIPIAAAVAMAESGGDPEVIGMVSKTGPDGQPLVDNQDLGLWQISNKWHAAKVKAIGGSWRGPYANGLLAKQVFDEFVAAGRPGWEAWAVYNSGAYKKYLALAQDQFAKGFLWPPVLGWTGWMVRPR